MFKAYALALVWDVLRSDGPFALEVAHESKRSPVVCCHYRRTLQQPFTIRTRDELDV